MAEHNHNKTKFHISYGIVILILLVVAIGEYVYFNKKVQSASVMNAHPAMMMANGKQRTPMMGSGSGKMPSMAMAPQTPPAVSDQQTAQLKMGTDTSTTNKTFNITGGNFYFVPKNITVNKGDTVTFVMTNAGGMHDIKIDELGIETPIIKTGNAVTATFTASKTGTFVYYCDVPGHKAKGMWGTLTVQ